MENTKVILHKSESRGYFDHGWLKTNHTFSFADYYDPQRVNFGALRVLNDDFIEAGNGFGMHPHKNMEIITIPLTGGVLHRDSMGSESVIRWGDIQVMSAGSGVYHSEYNASDSEELTLLQIWVIPDRVNVEPRYEEIKLDINESKNQLYNIVSPFSGNAPAKIYQNAYFNIGCFDNNTTIDYKLNSKENGVYLFLISGEIKLDKLNTSLTQRDGVGIIGADTINISVTAPDTKILIMEVPMF